MKKNLTVNMEKILFISFVAVFLTMVFAQAALMSPEVRAFLSVDNESEGAPLGAEEYLYKRGSLVLELKDRNYDYNLKVLVNGDQKARFFEKTVDLDVKDGDVVEIDASAVEEERVVAIAGRSENLPPECLNTSVKVKSNVKRLIKVKIK